VIPTCAIGKGQIPDRRSSAASSAEPRRQLPLLEDLFA
jgi:hypothetical protein